MTAIQNAANREAHQTCTLFYSSNLRFIIYKNTYYSIEKFNEIYPLPRIIEPDKKYLKGDNPDRTKDWLK